MCYYAVKIDTLGVTAQIGHKREIQITNGAFPLIFVVPAGSRFQAGRAKTKTDVNKLPVTD